MLISHYLSYLEFNQDCRKNYFIFWGVEEGLHSQALSKSWHCQRGQFLWVTFNIYALRIGREGVITKKMIFVKGNIDIDIDIKGNIFWLDVQGLLWGQFVFCAYIQSTHFQTGLMRNIRWHNHIFLSDILVTNF